MMTTDTSFLKNLTNEELQKIIDCKSFNELKSHFQNLSAIEDYFAKKRKLSMSGLIESFWETFENLESNGFNLDPSFCLALSSNGIGTGVLAATSFVMAALSLVNTYEKNKDEQVKREKNIQFMNLKVACYDELIDRQAKEFGNENKVTTQQKSIPKETLSDNQPEIKPKHRAQIIQEAFNKFLKVSTKVFKAVMPAIPKILTLAGCVGAATVMGGTIGLGIGIGLSVIVGATYAYNYFKKNTEQFSLKKREKQITRELAEKEKYYSAHRNKIKGQENTFNKVQEKLKEPEKLKSFQNDARVEDDSNDLSSIDFDNKAEPANDTVSSNQLKFFKPQNKIEKKSLELQPILSSASYSSAL